MKWWNTNVPLCRTLGARCCHDLRRKPWSENSAAPSGRLSRARWKLWWDVGAVINWASGRVSYCETWVDTDNGNQLLSGVCYAAIPIVTINGLYQLNIKASKTKFLPFGFLNHYRAVYFTDLRTKNNPLLPLTQTAHEHTTSNKSSNLWGDITPPILKHTTVLACYSPKSSSFNWLNWV